MDDKRHDADRGGPDFSSGSRFMRGAGAPDASQMTSAGPLALGEESGEAGGGPPQAGNRSRAKVWPIKGAASGCGIGSNSGSKAQPRDNRMAELNSSPPLWHQTFETQEEMQHPAGGFLDTKEVPPLEEGGRRTKGDLSEIVLGTFPEGVDSGSSTLLDLTIDRIWTVGLQIKARNSRKLRQVQTVGLMGKKTAANGTQCLDNYIGLLLATIGQMDHWIDDRSPWRHSVIRRTDETAKAVQCQGVAAVQILSHTQLARLGLTGVRELQSLGDVIHDVVVTDLPRFGLPLRPDQYKLDVGIKVLTERVSRLLQYRAHVERYRHEQCVEVWDAAARDACNRFDERIMPLLKSVRQSLSNKSPGMDSLHRDLLALSTAVWMQKGTETEIVDEFVRREGGNVGTFHNPKYLMASLCTALVDAPLHSISRDGLTLTISHYLDLGGENDLLPSLQHAVRCLNVVGLLDLEGISQRLKWAQHTPANDPMITFCSIELRTSRLIQARSNAMQISFQERLKFLQSGQKCHTYWAILITDILQHCCEIDKRRAVISDLLAETYAQYAQQTSPDLLQSYNELRHISFFHFDALAEARRPVAELLERCMAGTNRHHASVSAAAEKSAQSLIAQEGSGKRRRRRRRKATPAAAEVEPQRQAPQLEPPIEQVTAALVHDRLVSFAIDVKDSSVDVDYRSTYAQSAKGNLLHFLKLLNERRDIVGDERLYGDLDLLRRILECAIELTAAHFPVMEDSGGESVLRTHTFRSHELHKLLEPILSNEQIAPNVRHILYSHREIVHALSQANRCVNYPESAAHLATSDSASDQRTRWLLGYLERDYDAAEHRGLVDATLCLVTELLKGIQDREYRAGDVGIIVTNEPTLPERISEVGVSDEAPADIANPITTDEGARYGLDAMMSWIELKQVSPSGGGETCKQLRNRSLEHAALYLRRLRSRMGREERLELSCDTCWGEVDLVHRLIKELLVGALFHRGEEETAMANRFENNPLLLAPHVGPEVPPLPGWLTRAHAMVCYPNNFDGSARRGELYEALAEADGRSHDLDLNARRQFVTEFEQRFIFPAIQTAWLILERNFPPAS
jgi:hypothetical protein